MKKATTLSVLLVLVASSVVGAVGLGATSPLATKQHTILSPLQFQLNGRDPYTINVPMTQGETISGEVNLTGGAVTFSIVLQGVMMQSKSVSGSSHYQFTATTPGAYDLVFDSARPVLISVDVYSR